jgi:hypothetical protein
VADAPKTCEQLWASIQKGFWAIPGDSLDNLFHQKTVSCVQIARKNGASVQNDIHTGYRAAKNKLGRKPTWVEMRSLAMQKARWIYNYEPDASSA